MPSVTYSYVYFQSGRHDRRPRAAGSGFNPIPGLAPITLSDVEAPSKIQVSPAFLPATWPPADAAYLFSFVNVSGGTGGGGTSFDRSAPPPPATVGTAPIVVLVVYVPVGSGPTGTDFGATIDAFDESTNLLVDDVFVTASPDGGQTDSGNIDGWVDTTSNAETITAFKTITPTGSDPNQVTAVFDKWVNLQPMSTQGIVISQPELCISVNEGTNVSALAFYQTPPPPGAFFIQNPWSGLVIDIAEAGLREGEKPPARTPLDAFTKKGSSYSNQLWTFVQADVKGLEFVYFLQNPWTGLVLEINEKGVPVEGPIPEGAHLDANAMNAASDLDLGLPVNANQLWGFSTDPGGSGHYFIHSAFFGFVIDIAEGGLRAGETPKPGAPLDAFAQKTGAPGNANQLWAFVDPSGNPVTVPPPSRPSPAITAFLR